MQFLIPELSGQPNALNTTLTIQMDTAGAGLCWSHRGPSGLQGTSALAGALHPTGPCGWCRWPCDIDSSSQKVPESPQVLHVSSRGDKYWQIRRCTGLHFFPVSSILTKGGGGGSLSNGFFFCLILLPPSLPPVIWFFTPHLCVFIQLIFVFSFFSHLWISSLPVSGTCDYILQLHNADLQSSI